MKKQIIAGMMLLVLTVSGCSAVSTAPTTINELAEESRAETETDRTDSILSSESMETDAPVEGKTPEETESPESAAVPETAIDKGGQSPKQRHHSRLRRKMQKRQSLRRQSRQRRMGSLRLPCPRKVKSLRRKQRPHPRSSHKRHSKSRRKHNSR